MQGSPAAFEILLKELAILRNSKPALRVSNTKLEAFDLTRRNLSVSRVSTTILDASDLTPKDLASFRVIETLSVASNLSDKKLAYRVSKIIFANRTPMIILCRNSLDLVSVHLLQLNAIALLKNSLYFVFAR